MTREEKIQALFQDKEAVKEVFVGDADQTLANLAAHGIEMSMEELGEMSSGILEGMGITVEDELSEDALEDVAGGGLICGAIISKMLDEVGSAVKTGISKGRQDKKNKTAKGIGWVESANTSVGKGWRGIGYTIGYYL